MLKDVSLGQYYPADSMIHRLDPRTKICLIFFYVIIIFLIRSFGGFIVLGLLTFLVIRASRIPVRYLVRSLRPVLVIIGFTLLLHALFTRGGEVWLELGFIRVESQGFISGIFMSSRLVLLVMVTSLLTLTTSPISLTDGLEYLLGPFKKIGVPAHELAMMMTISLRFIPVLIKESEKIMRAQAARGASFGEGSLVNRARNMIPLIVPLFISAFHRAEDLAVAMEARCYRGGENRTRLYPLRLGREDLYASLLLCLFLLAVVASGL